MAKFRNAGYKGTLDLVGLILVARTRPQIYAEEIQDIMTSLYFKPKSTGIL